MFSGWRAFIGDVSGMVTGICNTIGVNIVGFMGYDKHIKEHILKNEDKESHLEYIYKDPIPLFNELTLDTYMKGENGEISWEQLTGNDSVFHRVIKDKNSIGENNMKILANHIKNKNLISYMIWYILLGAITLFMSINNMISDKRCATTTRDETEFNKAFSNH